jgi:hypothetical protein
MKKRFSAGLLAAVMAVFLLAASSAPAAVQFGDDCVGNETTPGSYTITTLSAPGPLSITAPVSGVITKMSVSVPPLPFSLPSSVKVLRSAGGNNFTVTGQATVGSSGVGGYTETRVPVQAGDRLGLHGLPFVFEGTPSPGVTIYCDEVADGSVLGAAPGEVGLGATANFIPVDEASTPVLAFIEADADNDGFGDETQDKCPQSAALQTPCPLAALEATTQIGRRAVTVLVTTTAAVPVQVSGTVNLGKGKKATLTAAAQTVSPGQLAKFKLKFTKKLKERLKELSPKQKLTLKIAASATNVTGAVSVDKVNAKLKGQAK